LEKWTFEFEFEEFGNIQIRFSKKIPIRFPKGGEMGVRVRIRFPKWSELEVRIRISKKCEFDLIKGFLIDVRI